MTDLRSQPKKPASWDESIKTIFYAVLIAVVFRSLFFEPFHIPSGSMKSNLLVGDYLFVSKFSYGYSRYSFPFGIMPMEGRILSAEPKRGDVIVFRRPSPPYPTYIKRLIGLPGDRIRMKNGILHINDTPLKREYVDDFLDTENPQNAISIPRFKETLPEGREILVLKKSRSQLAGVTMDDIDPNNTDTVTVPENHYFMMGDNRDNSRDSRYPEVQFVPHENLIGRADLIFFSIDPAEAEWLKPWTWVGAMRFGRFLNGIE